MRRAAWGSTLRRGPARADMAAPGGIAQPGLATKSFPMSANKSLGLGIGMGIAVGAGIGAVLDDVAMGIGIGTALGIALACACGKSRGPD